MTVVMLEKKLKPFEDHPLEDTLLKWLYIHFPPRPMGNKRMYAHYSKMIQILMLELDNEKEKKRYCNAIKEYLASVIPFLEEYEKKEFAIEASSAEEVLKFLMEQNDLTQYDLASDLGGQSVVSDILRGKRKLTREHIERLSKRFGINPATFFIKTEKK